MAALDDRAESPSLGSLNLLQLIYKKKDKCATNNPLAIILNIVQYVSTFPQALVLQDINNYTALLSKKRDLTHKPLNHRYNEYQTTIKHPVGEIITSVLPL